MSPGALSADTVEAIIRLRKELTATGTGELLRELVLDPTRDYQPTGNPRHPTKHKQAEPQPGVRPFPMS